MIPSSDAAGEMLTGPWNDCYMPAEQRASRTRRAGQSMQHSLIRTIAVIASLWMSVLSPNPAIARRWVTTGPFDRRGAIAANEMLPPGSIDDHEAVEIGGIKQWISVKGANPNNPILLFVHGGPGSPMMPESWTFERPWEDFFTVVQWDQRGTGQTYSAAGRKNPIPLTIGQMQDDTEQLITYLLRRYHKKKIFLLGHSWGSVLGLRVAQHRPDLLFAYIGVGQVVNVLKNEQVGYALSLEQARKEHNALAVKELESISPYPGQLGPATGSHVAVERKWNSYFRGMIYSHRDDDEKQRWIMSPLYSNYDVRSAELGEAASAETLTPELLTVDFDKVSKLSCPFFLFAGAHDRTTPTVLAKAFFDQIAAPSKRYFEIADASHYVVNEAPGIVLVDLVQYVRPASE